MKQAITINTDPSYFGPDASDIWVETAVSHLEEIIQSLGFVRDCDTMEGTTEHAIHYVRGDADQWDSMGEEIIQDIDWFSEFCGGSLRNIGDHRSTNRMIREFGAQIS